MPNPLAEIKGLLIDLDGVVFTGSHPIPGSAGFLAEARRRGFPFLLATNNSTATPQMVAERLSAMGMETDASEVLGSAGVAAAYIASQTNGSARVLVVGESGLRTAVETAGLTPTDAAPADWVLAGLDRTFDYQKLSQAVSAIRGGARFVATNTDALLPVEGGAFLPGAGSIVAAIATATGVTPVVTGKPEPAMFRMGVEQLGLSSGAEVAMVGDRVDTDITGAQMAGLRAILVLSGVTTAEEAAILDPQPDAIVASLANVAGLLGWS